MGYKANLEGSSGSHEKKLIGRGGSFGWKTEPKSQRCGRPGNCCWTSENGLQR